MREEEAAGAVRGVLPGVAGDSRARVRPGVEASPLAPLPEARRRGVRDLRKASRADRGFVWIAHRADHRVVLLPEAHAPAPVLPQNLSRVPVRAPLHVLRPPVLSLLVPGPLAIGIIGQLERQSSRGPPSSGPL
jgi:hypothetical protein